MKKSVMMLIIAAITSLWTADVWAFGGHDTHNGSVSVSKIGEGTVYLSTSANETSGETSAFWSCGGDSGKDSATYYLYAQPAAGWSFAGWSGSGTSSDNPYKATLDAKNGDHSFTATFTKQVQLSFLAAENGTYTVTDGTSTIAATSEAKSFSTTKEVTMTAQPATGYTVGEWWYQEQGGSRVSLGSNREYKHVFGADATVGVEFIEKGETIVNKTTGARFRGLAAAIAVVNSGETLEVFDDEDLTDDVTLPSGVSLVVPQQKTLTVPAGKQLVVDGTIAVVGSVINSGVISGNGKLMKVSKIISQGEIQTLYMANGEECPKITEAHHTGVWPKYRKTTVEVNTPSVTGNAAGCATTGWGVYFNGKVTSISKQSPVAVKVNVNTANAVNDITTVVDNGDVDSITAQGAYVLFADCAIKGPPRGTSGDDAKRLNFNGTVDCAGKKVTFGLARTYSDFAPIILNGTVDFQPTTDFQNAAVLAFGCSSITIKNIKGTSGKQYFYDCGTPSSTCSITLGFQSSSSRTAYFYNGYYKYTFSSSNDGASKCNVYGGSYTSDPTSYIPSPLNDELYAPQEGSMFVVQLKPEAVRVARIGTTEYKTLDAALEAATAGSTITLIAGIDLTDKTVTVASDKQVTIDLNKHQIKSGKIENHGTLVITDYATANESPVGADIENHGTLDFIFGTYNGDIVNKAGTLTIHNGAFNGSISSDGGTLVLKGGHFTQDVGDLVTAENTQVFVSGGKYYVCEMPNGTFYAKTVSSVSGYGVTPYTTVDYDLLDDYVGGKSLRTDYSDAGWTRLAELLPFYEVYSNRRLDPTLVFDRDVAANSLKLNVQSSLTLTRALGVDVAAGGKYRTLSEVLAQNGYSGKTYKALWDDGIKEVAVSFSNESSVNAGTLCTLMVELWETARAPDYSSNGHMLSNTVCVVGQEYFAIGAGSNIAMIRPATGAATFYANLASAMNAVADNGTVMLANDCATALTLPKAGTYTFDPMCFEMSEAEPVVGEGLVIQSTSTSDSAAVALKPGANATTYVVVSRVDTPTISASVSTEVPSGGGVAVTGSVPSGLDGATYTLLKRNAAGSFEGVAGMTEKQSADFNLMEAGLYKIRVTANGQTAESPETIGVLAYGANQTTIVAVPWEEQTVAGLFATSGLVEGDSVKAYSKTDDAYEMWTKTAAGWEASPTVTTKGTLTPSAASERTLARGSAVWVTHANAIFLGGICPAAAPAPTTLASGWNLVANPNFTAFDLKSITGGANDRIIVPSATGLGQKTYTYENGAWGYMGQVNVERNGKVVGVRNTRITTETSIAPGQGFWYVKDGTGSPTAIGWTSTSTGTGN